MNVARVPEQPSDGFVFKASLVDGPDINLVRTSGLNLSPEQEDALWRKTNWRSLLAQCEAAGACAEIVLKELDSSPGMSDILYEYRCNDRAQFVQCLASSLIAVIQGATP